MLKLEYSTTKWSFLTGAKLCAGNMVNPEQYSREQRTWTYKCKHYSKTFDTYIHTICKYIQHWLEISLRSIRLDQTLSETKLGKLKVSSNFRNFSNRESGELTYIEIKLTNGRYILCSELFLSISTFLEILGVWKKEEDSLRLPVAFAKNFPYLYIPFSSLC